MILQAKSAKPRKPQPRGAPRVFQPKPFSSSAKKRAVVRGLRSARRRTLKKPLLSPTPTGPATRPATWPATQVHLSSNRYCTATYYHLAATLGAGELLGVSGALAQAAVSKMEDGQECQQA